MLSLHTSNCALLRNPLLLQSKRNNDAEKPDAASAHVVAAATASNKPSPGKGVVAYNIEFDEADQKWIHVLKGSYAEAGIHFAGTGDEIPSLAVGRSMIPGADVAQEKIAASGNKRSFVFFGNGNASKFQKLEMGSRMAVQHSVKDAANLIEIIAKNMVKAGYSKAELTNSSGNYVVSKVRAKLETLLSNLPALTQLNQAVALSLHYNARVEGGNVSTGLRSALQVKIDAAVRDALSKDSKSHEAVVSKMKATHEQTIESLRALLKEQDKNIDDIKKSFLVYKTLQNGKVTKLQRRITALQDELRQYDLTDGARNVVIKMIHMVKAENGSPVSGTDITNKCRSPNHDPDDANAAKAFCLLTALLVTEQHPGSRVTYWNLGA